MPRCYRDRERGELRRILADLCPRNLVTMTWIEEGYRLLMTTVVPERKEMCNTPSAIEHSAFVPGAVAEMLSANAVHYHQGARSLWW